MTVYYFHLQSLTFGFYATSPWNSYLLSVFGRFNIERPLTSMASKTAQPKILLNNIKSMQIFQILMGGMDFRESLQKSMCLQKWRVWCLDCYFHKGGFFSESAIRFSKLQTSKKNIPKSYPELEIWICCLLLLAGNLNFKLRIAFWNISFWDFEMKKVKRTF